MNRREFVQRFFMAGVVLAVPFQWAYGQIRHRLYGDGKTDDTVAFQALLDGESVIMPDGQWVQCNGNMVHLTKGTYRITETLNDLGTYPETIDGSGTCLKYDGDDLALRVTHGQNRIKDLRITSAQTGQTTHAD